MDCKTAKLQAALSVGGDLPESDAVGLQRHLATCPQCREHNAGLKTTYAHITSAGQSTRVAGETESLWPNIANTMQVRRSKANVKRFNGWVAGLAVAATMLAMVTISQHLPSAQSEYNGNGVLEVSPTNFNSNSGQYQLQPRTRRPFQFNRQQQTVPLEF